MEQQEIKPLDKKTSTEKYEQLMRECREMQERNKARLEQQKKTDEMVKNATESAKSAINNYDKWKKDMSEILDKQADAMATTMKNNPEQFKAAMKEVSLK